MTYPDTKVVNYSYWPTGEQKRTWGARTYPVEYTYEKGRMKTLTTWQDFAGNDGQAVTEWFYDAERGWLERKEYADGMGPSYTYWPSGRLHTRTWGSTGNGEMNAASSAAKQARPWAATPFGRTFASGKAGVTAASPCHPGKPEIGT